MIHDDIAKMICFCATPLFNTAHKISVAPFHLESVFIVEGSVPNMLRKFVL